MSDYGAQVAASTVTVSLAGALGGIHMYAMAGALVGSFFFLSLPSTVKGIKAFFLWIASIGAGYFTGYTVSLFGYEVVAAISAFGGGAFGATILTALQKYFDGGPMPDFLTRIFDRIPFLQSKRSNGDV